MAADNITPIYGEWLVRHMDYYVFRGETADALKKELMAIDVSSSESDGALVDCYRRFISLFVNNVYDTAFDQVDQGIVAVNNRGFLVNNQYNVPTPIGFMEENGKKGTIDLDFSNSAACRKIGEKREELENVTEETKERLEGFGNWPKGNKPSIIFACGTLALCILIIICFFMNQSTISAADFQFPMVILWGGTAVATFVGVIKTVQEFEALRRWKRLKQLKEWFGNFLEQGNTSQSILEEYQNRLADMLAEGSEFPIPKPAQSLKSYFSFLDGQAKALRDLVRNPVKMRKKIGKILPILLAIVLVFVAYGQGNWGGVDALRNFEPGEKSEDGSVAEGTKEHSAVPVLVGMNPVNVAEARASSELVTKTDTYSVAYTYDKDAGTCWQDGMPGDGCGEILIYYFDQPRYIVGVDIINGRVVSEEKYYNNNRIESMIIYYFLEGGVTTSVEVHLEDVYDTESVHFDLTSGVLDEVYYCEGVQIEIQSIYKGDKYSELCLTEIQFYEGIYE